jgi:hypothetical protein
MYILTRFALNSVLSFISYYFIRIYKGKTIQYINFVIHTRIYTICTVYRQVFFLASRDFFQEKQSDVLTESPLSKYEGETKEFIIKMEGNTGELSDKSGSEIHGGRCVQSIR